MKIAESIERELAKPIPKMVVYPEEGTPIWTLQGWAYLPDTLDWAPEGGHELHHKVRGVNGDVTVPLHPSTFLDEATFLTWLALGRPAPSIIAAQYFSEDDIYALAELVDCIELDLSSTPPITSAF